MEELIEEFESRFEELSKHYELKFITSNKESWIFFAKSDELPVSALKEAFLKMYPKLNKLNIFIEDLNYGTVVHINWPFIETPIQIKGFYEESPGDADIINYGMGSILNLFQKGSVITRSFKLESIEKITDPTITREIGSKDKLKGIHNPDAVVKFTFKPKGNKKIKLPTTATESLLKKCIEPFYIDYIEDSLLVETSESNIYIYRIIYPL